MNRLIRLFLLTVLSVGCSQEEASLPILGRSTIADDGETMHEISDFEFVNQYSDTISNAAFDGKIYVTDFFFTSCPTICPVMKSQMLRINEHFQDESDVLILSHTIDPYHDSVDVLREYAEALGVTDTKWQFVTGDQDAIYEIAQNSYMVAADADTLSPEETGGFVHSGAFILVDRNRHVRGMYDGTEEEQVNQLIRDMELLLKEE